MGAVRTKFLSVNFCFTASRLCPPCPSLSCLCLNSGAVVAVTPRNRFRIYRPPMNRCHFCALARPGELKKEKESKVNRKTNESKMAPQRTPNDGESIPSEVLRWVWFQFPCSVSRTAFSCMFMHRKPCCLREQTHLRTHSTRAKTFPTEMESACIDCSCGAIFVTKYVR